MDWAEGGSEPMKITLFIGYIIIGDIAEMCDLKRTTVQCIFKGCPGIRSVFSMTVKLLNRDKHGNISTLHRDVKNRRVRLLHICSTWCF